MNNQTFFELIGYLASSIIAISLLMKSLIRLRIINGIGALVFVIYGFLIKAYPVAILNGVIVIIDIYYLIQMMNRKDYFSLMKVAPKSEYLTYFVDFHLDDIQNFFPNFSYIPNKSDLAYFILRNTVPAGLVVLRKIGNKAEVLLDYALKDYRDFKIGNFIFDDNADILLNHGINYLEADSVVPGHKRYLHQMGFVEENENRYVRELKSRYIRDEEI